MKYSELKLATQFAVAEAAYGARPSQLTVSMIAGLDAQTPRFLAAHVLLYYGVTEEQVSDVLDALEDIGPTK